jgi:prepilin-type N-terminal cleavage/methylation domain-containing protein
MTISKNRGGFTLVELLVVIAIIGTLVGLLLPAVQAAREAARRSACINNTRQLALSVLNHESTRRRLPAAGDRLSGSNLDSAGYSWIAMVLPYLEETNLYNAMSASTSRFSSGNGICPGAQTTVLPQLICPSYAGTTTGGITCYKAAAGVSQSSATMPWSSDGSATSGGAVTSALDSSTGNSKGGILIGQISDGTSKTFAISENAIATGTANSQWVYGDRNFVTAQTGTPTLTGSTWSLATANLNPTSPTATSPSSNHVGRLVVHGYVDGHVGVVQAEIDNSLFSGLYSRSGGEAVSGDLP